jgi:hypothetical protein
VVLAVKDNKSRKARAPDPPRAAVDDEIEMPAPDLRRDVGPIDRPEGAARGLPGNTFQ